MQPGRDVGATSAADVNAVLDLAERLIADASLPPNMDGFGSRALKRATYRDVMRTPLAFAGIKLFLRQDTDLLTAADVMRLEPQPSVVVYQ